MFKRTPSFMVLLGTTVTLAVSLSACGFKLRGQTALPAQLERVFIDVEQGYAVLEPPIVGDLRRALRARGAEVVAKSREASSAIVITRLENDERILSVGADGKALEYELTVAVSYVLKQNGEIVLPMQSLALSRDYTFDADAILAEEAEAKQLNESLQADLAELMLLRLEYSLSERANGAERAKRPDRRPAPAVDQAIMQAPAR